MWLSTLRGELLRTIFIQAIKTSDAEISYRNDCNFLFYVVKANWSNWLLIKNKSIQFSILLTLIGNRWYHKIFKFQNCEWNNKRSCKFWTFDMLSTRLALASILGPFGVHILKFTLNTHPGSLMHYLRLLEFTVRICDALHITIHTRRT